jgi:hypothetical protein
MRKMILIAAIAQPKAHAAEARPVADDGRAAISRPRRRHVFVAARFLSGWARPCW